MLGPSPDWIVGVSALEMCQINCTWIDNKVCTWMYDKVCTWIYDKVSTWIYDKVCTWIYDKVCTWIDNFGIYMDIC